MAAGRTFVRNKNWTNTHHVADVVARYQKTFFDKLDVGILAGCHRLGDAFLFRTNKSVMGGQISV